jgi:hypothetical protein
VEAYIGWDGGDYAVYANWTLDAGGHCGGGGDCAAPMVVRLPKDSKAHAFFQLGWAIHLLEDNTTPVHTIDGSVDAFEMHNDVETMADYAITTGAVTAGLIKELIPADTTADFVRVYDWPPTPDDSSCQAKAPVNPSFYFQERWYADALPRMSQEGVAHAYTRNLAEVAHRFIPYIECINTEADLNWLDGVSPPRLDNAVKATVISFASSSRTSTRRPLVIAQPTATSYPHFGTLTLSYSARRTTNPESSVAVTLDERPCRGARPERPGDQPSP